MKTLRLSLFALLATVQIAVPAWMIARQLSTLREGRPFKFRTAPVDPYDAFRGSFVALQFKAEQTDVPGPFQLGERVYVALAEDADGFAKVERLSREPLRGDNVIRAKTAYSPTDRTYLAFPFDRYYLEEKAAPQAEEAYRNASRRGHEDAWVTVRVHDGYAAIEELYIDGKPIREFLREPISH